MGIITFFGVIVTLKLSSPIFKACLLKKGGMGVDMRSIGSWWTERANAVSARARDLCCIFATPLYLVCFDPLHLVLYSCNTPT